MIFQVAPPDNRLQRRALRAVADPGRWAAGLGNELEDSVRDQSIHEEQINDQIMDRRHSRSSDAAGRRSCRGAVADASCHRPSYGSLSNR